MAKHGWNGVGIGMILALFSMSGSSGGANKMTSFTNASVPGVELVQQHFCVVWAVILALFVINSFLAGALAPANSAVRMM